MERLLRNISFGLLAAVTLALATATLIGKEWGAAEALCIIYHSPLVIALWFVMAACALVYIWRRRSSMSLFAIAIHVALAIILIGAFVSYLTGLSGSIRLVGGEKPVDSFVLDNGGTAKFPFSIGLESVSVKYYPATSSAMDYESVVKLVRNDAATEICRISMNNILVVDGYRFYQTSMGDAVSTLSVSYDPWGIGVTYAGYVMFGLAVCAFAVATRKRFVRLLRNAAVVLSLIFVSFGSYASESDSAPEVLQRPLAANLGKLYAYWNGRVVPLQTVAREFCLKVHGSASYKGMTPEQILSGWLFYYADWKNEPFIKVSNEAVVKAIGIDGSYASLADFYRDGQYVLDGVEPRSAMAADEKVGMVSGICTGRLIKIFPIPSANDSVEWLSWVDDVTDDIAAEAEMNSIMESLAREIAHGRFRNAYEIVSDIRDMQLHEAREENLPSSLRFEAERLYNQSPDLLLPAILAMLAGLTALLFVRMRLIQLIITVAAWAYLTYLLALQWIIGGHIPMSNGYETMQTMSWIALLLGVACNMRLPLLSALCSIAGAFAMLVSYISGNNPVVSPLIPVLASPLLSIHVFMVMVSYALFAVMMLISVVAFFRRKDDVEFRRLASLSELLLYPAVFALGIGIFIGAVWANQSWGRYWGWDPKETWALITFIIYSVPLHRLSFASFRRPAVLHVYLFIAFAAVLITYFGVNYLLPGMHSYAMAQ